MSKLRNRHLLILDAVLLSLGAVASFCLRLDFELGPSHWQMILVFLLIALPFKLTAFYYAGLYQRIWAYSSVTDMFSIVLASSTSVVLITALLLGLVLPTIGLSGFPRSVPIIDWLLTIAIVGGDRFLICWLSRLEQQRRKQRQFKIKMRDILIMGAGNAGALIVKEMLDNPQLGLRPVGFIDDDSTKLGLSIHGIPVMGTRDDIPRLTTRHGIQELIVAIPSAPGEVIRDILEICQKVNLTARTVPGMNELIAGEVSVAELRDINIEDLLRREPVQTDMSRIRKLIQGSRVMVTGGGGSIGSELCRQICRYDPAALVFLGHGENSIFKIEQELKGRFPQVAIQPVIADIRDRDRLHKVLGLYAPDIIFHAAAHKHVPLMESNEEEAVLNNVLGTLNLVELAAQRPDTRFVMISSDKAVNPTNIMGATKRIAELVTQAVALKYGACFAVVRFGNVLGSRGSVLHTFRDQIQNGGPITVTHPDMSRFFMTIPEAVQLVLQAATLGTCGEVYVLDMGEPIKIVDLATDLARLYGRQPGRDIEIVYTGIRPGEKLYEELFVEGESYQRTEHEKIFATTNHAPASTRQLERQVEALIDAARQGQPNRVRELINEIEPHCELSEERPGPAIDTEPSTDCEGEQLFCSHVAPWPQSVATD